MADFGLSKAISYPSKQMSKEVQTLWYRAPELILGTEHYGSEIDMWSIGCLFVEFLIYNYN